MILLVLFGFVIFARPTKNSIFPPTAIPSPVVNADCERPQMLPSVAFRNSTLGFSRIVEVESLPLRGTSTV